MDDRRSLIPGDRHKAVYPNKHGGGSRANWNNATIDSPKWRAKKEATRMVFRLGTIQVMLRAGDADEGGEAEKRKKKTKKMTKTKTRKKR